MSATTAAGANQMKGIILAGGKDARLPLLTEHTNKHLLGVYDRPMIVYPIETLRSLGVTEILIISSGEHIGGFAELLDDGSRFGVDLTYRVQRDTGGPAAAIALAEPFVGDSRCVVMFGDNIFENDGLPKEAFLRAVHSEDAFLFLHRAKSPANLGAPEVADGRVLSVGNGRHMPNAGFTVTGMYAYPPDVFHFAKTLASSRERDAEIADLNAQYVREGRCRYFETNGFWADAGTIDSLVAISVWAKSRDKKKVIS
jgi:glucose-1-phosphate thymidylyltransferase